MPVDMKIFAYFSILQSVSVSAGQDSLISYAPTEKKTKDFVV